MNIKTSLYLITHARIVAAMNITTWNLTMKPETIKQILENAAEGSTHVDSSGQYWKKVDGYKSEFFHKRTVRWVATSNCNITRALSDLRELQEKDQELAKMQARIDELEKERDFLTDDLLETQDNLASLQSAFEGIELVFCDEDGCPLIEPFNSDGLSKWIESFKLTQQAKGISDFKEWVYKTDKNKSGLDVRDIDLADLFIESLLEQAKELK